MSAVKLGIVAAMLLLLAACANTYGSRGITGGYSETEIEPGIWRVYYGGNGFTTFESVQTYWLYRCAELAQQKGYEGFEILSNLRLVWPDDQDRTLHLARGAGPIIVPMYGASSPKPHLEADIRFLRRPFEAKPPKVFDAAALKQTLEPVVNGAKCDGSNVCPHVHRYLSPEGMLPPPAPPTGNKT